MLRRLSRAMRWLSRTVRWLSTRGLRAALPSRGCWQLDTSEMQKFGAALHQLMRWLSRTMRRLSRAPAAMTGPSQQCILTTVLLGTLVPARGRRQQVGLQLRLASLASCFS